MKTRSQVLLVASALLSILLLHVFLNSDREHVVRIENINNIAWVNGEVQINPGINSKEPPLVEDIIENKCQDYFWQTHTYKVTDQYLPISKYLIVGRGEQVHILISFIKLKKAE